MTNERPPMQHRTSSSGSLLTDRRMTFTAAISAAVCVPLDLRSY